MWTRQEALQALFLLLNACFRKYFTVENWMIFLDMTSRRRENKRRISMKCRSRTEYSWKEMLEKNWFAAISAILKIWKKLQKSKELSGFSYEVIPKWWSRGTEIRRYFNGWGEFIPNWDVLCRHMCKTFASVQRKRNYYILHESENIENDHDS